MLKILFKLILFPFSIVFWTLTLAVCIILSVVFGLWMVAGIVFAAAILLRCVLRLIF